MKAQYPVPVFWSSTQFASRRRASGFKVVVVGVVVVVVGTVVVLVVESVVVVVKIVVVVVAIGAVVVVVSAQFGTEHSSHLSFGSVV